jgi:cytochrome P450
MSRLPGLALRSPPAAPSRHSTILATDNKLTPEEAYLKWTANSMYSASLDTSTATIITLVLFLLQCPEIAARAREELDSIVRPTRLLNFNDRPNLR